MPRLRTRILALLEAPMEEVPTNETYSERQKDGPRITMAERVEERDCEIRTEKMPDPGGMLPKKRKTILSSDYRGSAIKWA